MIRGELLKKYPTAVIYAHRAAWQLDDDGAIDTEPSGRTFDDPAARRRTWLRTPLYEAKVDPDIYVPRLRPDGGRRAGRHRGTRRR